MRYAFLELKKKASLLHLGRNHDLVAFSFNELAYYYVLGLYRHQYLQLLALSSQSHTGKLAKMLQ